MLSNSFKDNPKKILVADDDEAIADALKLMLEMAGYEVSLTKNGDTLRTITMLQPDLVLLDIWMSGIDGREICATLKSDRKTKDIPVILVSASRNASASVKQCSADDFIAKPFEMKDLLKKVDTLTQIPSNQAASL